MIKSNAIANTQIVFAPILLMVFTVVAMNAVLSLSIIGIAYIAGLTMLMRSKSSLFRQGIWCALGPGKLDAENRRRYFDGYAIIACTMIINVASMALLRF